MEERKVKIGGQEKVEVAFAKMKSSARGRLSSFLEKEPELLGSSEQMVLYNINLMEKIQLRENRKLMEVARLEVEVDEVD